MRHLAKEIDHRLKSLFKPSKFASHITVARFRKPENLKELTQTYADVAIGNMVVDKITLFESKISSTGAEYLVFNEWPLA